MYSDNWFSDELTANLSLLSQETMKNICNRPIQKQRNCKSTEALCTNC